MGIRPTLGLLIISILAAYAAGPAAASLVWTWNYNEAGISASGTLTTDDAANAAGFFPITGISGARNGVAITALQPAGTAIPGNEPFLVDNLIRAGTPQLTGNGFGFALADGTFANAFFADFLTPPSYLEFFSAPPFVSGVIGPEDSERPVAFTASIPEPASAMLLLVGCLGLLAASRLRHGEASRLPRRGNGGEAACSQSSPCAATNGAIAWMRSASSARRRCTRL